MKLPVWGLLSILVAWTVAGLAIAQEAIGKRVALVIGNSAYAHLRPLANPGNDARLMADTFEKMGFEVASVLLDRGKSEMLFALQDFADEVADAEMVAVYFAGHGLEIAGTNYLVPVDARIERKAHVPLASVSLNTVLQAIERPGRLSLVLLDACRDNPLGRGRSVGAGRGLVAVETRTGTIVGYAAKHGTLALDGNGRNSPFALALAEHLPTPGLDIRLAFGGVKDSVSRSTAGDQEPWLYQNLGRDVLALVPQNAVPQSSEAADWRLALRFDRPEAYRNYVNKHCPGGANCGFATAALEAAKPAPPAPQLVELAVGVFSKYAPGETFKDCSDCPEMVVVPAGRFTMGSSFREEGRGDDEGPLREVTIGYNFAVGRFEVTFDQWLTCMDGGGCGREVPDDESWGRGKRPVINVSWNQAQDYVAWLSGETGATYRLLSEAEWEYAARAGTQTPFHFGETISTDQANYDGDYTYGAGKKGEDRERTVPVGSFPPNDFGLFDMHGNVWEWVQDCYVKSYENVPNNGEAFGIGQCAARVVRGGSWSSLPVDLRSAIRSGFEPNNRYIILGFRVARTLTP